MTKVRRRKGLSGTVLIMILTVMVVLIIMLMATLSVVTTANQRIYTKFEENQAYYSARSALDIFRDNMLSDANYIAYDTSDASARQYNHGSGQHADMKQGLGLQLDLYYLTTIEPDGQNVTRADMNSYMTGVSGKDEYKNYFATDTSKVSSVGGVPGDPSYREYIEYQLVFPKISDEGSEGGWGALSDMVDTDGDGKKDSSVATIKVELLNRKYDVGTYTDGAGQPQEVPLGSVEDFFNHIDPYNPTGTISNEQIAEAVTNGIREKDKLKVKITATTTVAGVEGSAALIMDSNSPIPNTPNGSRAITALGSMNGSNHTFIIGGVSTRGTPGTGEQAPIGNGGGIFGTVYDEVGLYLNVGTPFYLTETEYVFIAEDFKIDNDGTAIKGAVTIDPTKPTAETKSERPFLFVGGQMIIANKLDDLGGSTAEEAVDIITLGGITWTSNAFTMNGDIYSKDGCTFNSTAATPNINGDFYIDGDLHVGGNVRVNNADGTIGLYFGSNCNLHISGLVHDDDTGEDFDPSVPGVVFSNDGGTIGTFVGSAIDIDNNPMSADYILKRITDASLADMGANVEINLPNSITKHIETHKKNYDEYYYINNGNYADASGGPSATPVHRSAKSLATKTDDPFDPYDFTNTFNHPADTLDSLEYGNMTIDTTTDPTSYVLHGGLNFNGKTLRIEGGGEVEIYLMPNAWSWDGNYWSGNGALDIIVADDTVLKVYGGVSGINYNFEKVRITTETVRNALPTAYGGTNAELKAGSKEGLGIEVPHIYYFFDGGTITFNNGEVLFAGYVYAPDSKLYSAAGSNMTFANLKYNDAPVPAGWGGYDVVGSVLCNDFEFQNNHGVIYINPALGGASLTNAGEPIHIWDAAQYTRY